MQCRPVMLGALVLLVGCTGSFATVSTFQDPANPAISATCTRQQDGSALATWNAAYADAFDLPAGAEFTFGHMQACEGSMAANGLVRAGGRTGGAGIIETTPTSR